MSRASLLALAVAALAATSAPWRAAAQPGRPLWTGDVALDTLPAAQGLGLATGPGVAIAPDGNGGAFVAWEDALSRNVQAQHLDATGALLWVADGVAVAPVAAFQMSPRAVADGLGGVVVAWVDGRGGSFCSPGFQADCDVFAQRLDAAGNRLWGPAGAPVTQAAENQGTSGIALAADGSGGAFFAWEDARPNCCKYFGQHLDAAGAPVWAPDGARVSPEPTVILGPVGPPGGVVPDGTGGAAFVFLDQQFDPLTTPGKATVQRLDAAGAPLLPAPGVAVAGLGGPVRVVSVAPGELVIVGSCPGLDAWPDVCAQRTDLAGAPRWASPVVLARTPGPDIKVDVGPDGARGVLAAWQTEPGACVISRCDVHAQRLDASGRVLWGADGLRLAEGVSPRQVSDGAGGGIVAWEDFRNRDSDLYAQRIAADGSLLWGAGGVAATTAVFNQGVDYGTEDVASSVMTTDGAGGAILAWPDGRNGVCQFVSAGCDVYAQRLTDRLGPAPVADLRLTLDRSPQRPVAAGDNLTATVTNAGPDVAHAVDVVVAQHDCFLDCASVDAPTVTLDGGVCRGVFAWGFECGLPSLDVGASATMTVAIKVVGPGHHAMDARVVATEIDPDLASNIVAGVDPTSPALEFALEASPRAVAISPGGTAAFAIAVTSLAVGGPVTLSCSGLPAEAACGFSPKPVPDGGSSTLTITTTAPHALALGAPRGTGAGGAALVAVAGTLALAGARPGRRRGRTRSLVALVLLAGAAWACGGNGGGMEPSPRRDPGTPHGVYTVTVTATRGTVVHEQANSLTVE